MNHSTAGRKGGSVISAEKAEAARENGRKGGAPKLWEEGTIVQEDLENFLALLIGQGAPFSCRRVPGPGRPRWLVRFRREAP